MLLLLLLSWFSRVRLCVTPQTAAYYAPPFLGFSRQKHWNGLPFPSPIHESEKWKQSCSVVSNSSRPHGLQPTRFLRPWDFSRQEYWSGVPSPSLKFKWDKSKKSRTVRLKVKTDRRQGQWNPGLEYRSHWPLMYCIRATRLCSLEPGGDPTPDAQSTRNMDTKLVSPAALSKG